MFKICDECEDISLLDVEVHSDRYGSGGVVEQDINKIKVPFADAEKSFVLDERFPARPRFENDEIVVSSFSAYARAVEQIKKSEQELPALQS